MSTTIEPKQNHGISQVLKNRFVQGILASALFLQIGIWVRNFAVLLYVMEMTKGDAFAISMISVAEFAPIFIFSFIGGTFADRWKPKRTMIWCETLSSISVFACINYTYVWNVENCVFCDANLCNPFAVFSTIWNEVV